MNKSEANPSYLIHLTEQPEETDIRNRADDEDIARVKAGDEDAFGYLLRRYQDRVYSIMYNFVLNREDALDLTQEVFVKAYLGLKHFRKGAAFYTWLYRIAVNTGISHLRKRPLKEISLEADDPSGMLPVDRKSDPYRVVASKELKERLQAAIASLPPPLKAALILHDIEGLTQEEVSDTLDCALGTVKSRISRARAILRRKLAGYWEGGEL